MRIVSPWHDYYDAALKHGQGDGAVFLRTTEQFGKNDAATDFYTTYRFLLEGLPHEVTFDLAGAGGTLTLLPFRVAFCGVTFNGIRIYVVPAKGEATLKHVYTQGDLIDTVLDYKLSKHHTHFHFDVHDPRKSAHPWSQKLHDFIDAQPDTSRKAFFSVNGEATVLARVSTQFAGGVLIRNPSLKAVEFYRVRDVAQAYQELEMFWDGRAAPENKPPVVIADKDRIPQHGFDKHSFRKPRTKRR